MHVTKHVALKYTQKRFRNRGDPNIKNPTGSSQIRKLFDNLSLFTARDVHARDVHCK